MSLKLRGKTQLKDNSVSFDKLANFSSKRILGRHSDSTGEIESLNESNARELLGLDSAAEVQFNTLSSSTATVSNSLESQGKLTVTDSAGSNILSGKLEGKASNNILTDATIQDTLGVDSAADLQGGVNVSGQLQTETLEVTDSAADLQGGATLDSSLNVLGEGELNSTTDTHTVSGKIEHQGDSAGDKFSSSKTNISGGSIEGTQIGLDSAGSGKFTDVETTQNLTVDGNLTVNVVTKTVDIKSQKLKISDPLLHLGQGNISDLVDMGIVFSYGATPNFAGLVRDASLEDGKNKFRLFDSAGDISGSQEIDFSQTNKAVLSSYIQGDIKFDTTVNITLTGDVVTVNSPTFSGDSAGEIITRIADSAVQFSHLDFTADDDAMSDTENPDGSDTKVPTQRSVKKYVEDQIKSSTETGLQAGLIKIASTDTNTSTTSFVKVKEHAEYITCDNSNTDFNNEVITLSENYNSEFVSLSKVFFNGQKIRHGANKDYVFQNDNELKINSDVLNEGDRFEIRYYIVPSQESSQESSQGSSDPTYSLSSSSTSVDEGGSFTITLTTTNVDDNTPVPYTVSGVDVNDFDGLDSENGNFNITNNSDTLDVSVKNNSITELSGQTFTLSLDGLSESVSVPINDVTPTYSLSSSTTTINEGYSVTLILATSNVPENAPVPFTISGSNIDPNDFSNLDSLGAGEFVVGSNNSATFNLIISSDNTTENSETFTVTLDGLGESLDITINDTSQDPVPIYNALESDDNVDEGSNLTINVSTTNVDDTTLYWTVESNSGDFDASSGSFLLTGGLGSFTVTPTADETTEEAETFTVAIRTGSDGGDIVATTGTITINDESKDPVPTYNALESDDNVDEGSDLIINVTTTNVADGDTLYWTTESNDGDFDASSGSFQITSGSGSFTVTPIADSTTENAETFTVAIRTGSDGGDIVATTGTITINDTSTSPYLEGATVYTVGVESTESGNVYTIDGDQQSSLTLNEGSTYVFDWSSTVNSPGHPVRFSETSDGTHSVGGSEYLTGVTKEDNIFRTTITVESGAPDLYYYCQLHPGMGSSISIYDPNPSYTVATAGNVDSVNEGSDLTINVTTTNVADGDTLYWTTESNDGDFEASSGSFLINSDSGSFTVTPTADSTTENAETFTVAIRTGSATGDIVATTGTITINDESTSPYPAGATVYTVGVEYTGSGNVYTIDGVQQSSLTLNEGSTYVFDWSSSPTHPVRFSETSNGTHSVGGSEYLTGVTKEDNIFRTTITVESGAPDLYYYCQFHSGMGSSISTYDPNPSYTVATAGNVDSVNEGSDLIINVTTTNVADNTTLYWIIESNAGDFEASSGSFLINSDSGSFTVTPTADNTTEGEETFTVVIKTDDSVTGTQVATTGTIKIGDESKDPVPTYSLSSNLDSADEGSTVTLTLQTSHVDENTPVPFTISGSGIVLEDFVNLDSLGAGEFTVGADGTATFDLELKSDSTTEGPETFTVVLDDHPSISVSVDINDTSTTPEQSNLIPSIYDLSVSPSSINEGQDITVTLTTKTGESVADGTLVPYTISGVQIEDFNVSSSSEPQENSNILSASDAGGGDWFGQSIAVSEDGSLMVVGAMYWDGDYSVNAGNEGAVYTYEWDSLNSVWSEVDIFSPFESYDMRFGTGIALSGDGSKMVVATSTKDIYTYERNGSSWSEIPDTEIKIGNACNSVSLSSDGTRLVIGDEWEYGPSDRSGSVWTFEWNNGTWGTWNERHGYVDPLIPELKPNSGGYRYYFGASVSISSNGSMLAVGSTGFDNNWLEEGIVYIYQWDASTNSWDTTSEIAINNPKPDYDYANFGSSVSFSGDGSKLAIGSERYRNGYYGLTTGEAYIYSYDGSSWNLQNEILPNSPEQHSHFGKSLAFLSDASKLIIGSKKLNNGGVSNSGGVYTFSLASSSQLTSLTGNFTVNSNTASLNLTALQDITTEGTETFTLTLDDSGENVSFDVGDTSQAPAYSLSSSSDSADEGTVVTITLDAPGVLNGTTVPFTVSGSGITLSDITSPTLDSNLQGEFTVSSQTASIDFTFSEDITTEGSEIFTLTLDSGPSIDVVINDISLDQSFDLSSSHVSANEGDTVTITLAAPHTPDGTSVSYTIDGTKIQTSDLEEICVFRDSVIENSNILLASDHLDDTYQDFGTSSVLSSDGNIMVVGAPTADVGLDGNVGQVYTYQWNDSTSSWDELNKFTGEITYDNHGDTIFNNFGECLAINDDASILVVKNSKRSSYSWIFTYQWDSETSSWSEIDQKELTNVSSLALSGDGTRLIVADRGAYGTYGRTGTVWTYYSETDSDGNFLGWGNDVTNDNYISDLKLDVERKGWYFGSSVSLSSDGNTLVVGAYNASNYYDDLPLPTDHTYGDQQGGYVFTYQFDSAAESWVFISDALSFDVGVGAYSDPNTIIYFGKSVSLSSDGKTLAVGAHGEGSNPTRSGAVYVYEFNSGNSSWERGVDLIKASSPGNDDYMGFSVSLSGDGTRMITGSPQYESGSGATGDFTGTDAGAIYTFDVKEYAPVPFTGESFRVYNGTAEIQFTISNDDLTENVAEFLSISLDNGKDSIEIPINDTSKNKSWDLTGPTSVNEGEVFQINLETTGLQADEQYSYQISGDFVESDLLQGSLSAGTFVISNSIQSTETLTFQFKSDALQSGDKTFTVSLDNGKDSISVLIKDQTYALSTNSSSADEGDTVIITLTTENVNNGTLVPYEISGVEIEDFIPNLSSLTGNFEIQNNQATLELEINYDYLTEVPQTLILDLDNGESSVSVLINDTSTNPSYSISGANSVNEGENIVLSITSNILDGRSIDFTISENTDGDTGLTADNISDVTGTGVTWNNDGTGSFIPSTSDGSVDITIETKVDDVIWYGNSFVFNSTEASLTKPVTVNENPVNYTVTSDVIEVSEGGSAINVTIQAENLVGDLSRTILVSSNNTDDAILSSTSLDMTSGSASFTLTPQDDSSVENNESIVLTLTDDGYSDSKFTVNSGSQTTGQGTLDVTIIDNDVAIYSISSNLQTIVENEGIVTFNITSNVLDGREVPFSIIEESGVSNIYSVTGNINVAGTHFLPDTSTGSASITVTLKTDSVYYEDNNFTLSVPGDSETIGITEQDTINYDITTSNLTISEGSPAITVDISASNVLNFSSPRTLEISCNLQDQLSFPSSVTIPAGSTASASFDITPDDDSNVELDQNITFTVTDSESSNFTVNESAGNTFTVNLLDNDIPQYTLSVQDNVAAINEDGGTVTFNISSNVLDGREVPFSIVETSGVDNINSISGNINGARTHFLPSTTDGSASITVVTKPDGKIKEDNSFTFSLTESGLSEVISITEQDTINYDITTSNLTIFEGSPAITVDISASNVLNFSSPRTLDISCNLQDQLSFPSSVTIPAGEYNLTDSIASASFNITPVDDSNVELDQNITFTVTDSESSNFTVNESAGNTFTVNLLDNDGDSELYHISSDFQTINEGAEVTFTITSNVLDGREVPFSIVETLGVDNIDSISGNINVAKTHFLPDTSTGSASITVVTKPDGKIKEGNSFTFSSTEAGLSEEIHLNEQDTINYDITTSNLTISEGSPAITVDISAPNVLNFSSPKTLDISCNLQDQLSFPSSVTIPAGSIASTSFTIIPVDDSNVELDQNITFTVTDSESSNFTVNESAGNTFTVNLLDNDDDAIYTLSVQDNVTAIDENGGTVTFIVETNIVDGQTVVEFEIIENIDDSTGLSADNIDIDNIIVTGGTVDGSPEIT